MSTTFRDIIYAVAARNRDLLHTLSETKDAISKLQNREQELEYLDGQVARVEAHCAEFENARKKELKQHNNYSGSIVKRLAYRVTGQTVILTMKVKMEDSGYMDILREAQRSQDELRYLVSLRDEARRERDHLEYDVAQHEMARKELDALYDDIFTEAPVLDILREENELRKTTDNALEEYHWAFVDAERIESAVSALDEAMERLDTAASLLDRTFHQSHAHVYGGPIDAWKDKRVLLQSTDILIKKSMSSWKKANRLLGLDEKKSQSIHIAERFKNRDILSDLSISREMFHEFVKDIQNENGLYRTALEAQLARTRSERSIVKRDVADKSVTLKHASLALCQARQLVFHKVTNNKSLADDIGSATCVKEDPPLYHA